MTEEHARTSADANANGREPLLRFERVTKRFGTFTAVDELSLDINRGEFFALLGPSGCGKSTLLRMAAGFDRPDVGRVLLAGRQIDDDPPHRRPVNMMFQSYALFPHMSVARNIGFGLRQERLPAAEIDQRVAQMLDLVQMSAFADRRPDQLSGGQRQRVALARALVKRPQVLMLDEPMAALDKKLREETQAELRALQRRLGTTFVIVTHDQQEAMILADRMAVMERGRIAQLDMPREVYERPASRYVATFIGDINLIEGTLVETGPDAVTIDSAAGPLHAPARTGLHTGRRVTLAIRPERVELGSDMREDATRNAVQARVESVHYLGDSVACSLRAGDLRLRASLPASANVVPGLYEGQPVTASWPVAAGIVLDD